MKNIFSILLLVVSIGIYFAYIHPTYAKVTGASELKDKSIKELRVDWQNYEEALEKTQRIEEAHNGLLQQFNSISEEDRDRVAKLIPDHIDSVRLVIEIMKIAEDQKLKVVDIAINTQSSKAKRAAASASSAPGTSAVGVGTPGLGPQRKNYEAVEFGFSLSGSYESFLEFLEDIEESLRIVDLTSVEFSSEEKAEYPFSIKFQTYLLK